MPIYTSYVSFNQLDDAKGVEGVDNIWRFIRGVIYVLMFT